MLKLTEAIGHDLSVQGLDKPSAVLFAADCAERVLTVFESDFPADPRPRRAIEEAREWVAQVKGARMRRAAGLAAPAAARDAAGLFAASQAARSAGRAAATTHAIGHALAAAAYAQRASSDQTERGWQLDRLKHYRDLVKESD